MLLFENFDNVAKDCRNNIMQADYCAKVWKSKAKNETETRPTPWRTNLVTICTYTEIRFDLNWK